MKITSIFFGIIVGLVLMVVLPYFAYQLNEYFNLQVFDNPVSNIIGAALILLGVGLFIYCSKIFKVLGKGTPVPIEPPKKIVQQGLYKYVRNPMYWGYFALVFGQAFFFGATLLFAYAVIFTIATHLYVVFFEERNLKRRFGDSYIQYTKQIPRWIPKV